MGIYWLTLCYSRWATLITYCKRSKFNITIITNMVLVRSLLYKPNSMETINNKGHLCVGYIFYCILLYSTCEFHILLRNRDFIAYEIQNLRMLSPTAFFSFFCDHQTFYATSGRQKDNSLQNNKIFFCTCNCQTVSFFDLIFLPVWFPWQRTKAQPMCETSSSFSLQRFSEMCVLKDMSPPLALDDPARIGAEPDSWVIASKTAVTTSPFYQLRSVAWTTE